MNNKELIERLRGAARAYPEDVFSPLTSRELSESANFISRCSAAMMRHATKVYLLPSATALEQADAENASLRADNKAAWDTNRAIDKARQEEMVKRDALTAEIAELRAQVERAREALETIADQARFAAGLLPSQRMAHDISSIHSNIRKLISTLTATTGNAVKQIEARESEFEIWQDDMMQASTSGPRITAARDALHYESQYGQDGPVQVFEVTRTPITAAELRKLAEQREQEGK